MNTYCYLELCGHQVDQEIQDLLYCLREEIQIDLNDLLLTLSTLLYANIPHSGAKSILFSVVRSLQSCSCRGNYINLPTAVSVYQEIPWIIKSWQRAGTPKNISSTKYDPVSPTLLAVRETVPWNITEATSFWRLNHLTQGTLCSKRLSEERVGVTGAPFSLLQAYATTKLFRNAW